MQFLKIFLTVLLISMALCSAAGAETILVADNFPSADNGANSVWLQYIQNGEYKDLKNLRPYLYGFSETDNGKFIAPVISLGERGNTDTRVNLTRIYCVPDMLGRNVGVMRISLPPATNGMNISGTAGIESGEVQFEIYVIDGEQHLQPLWSSVSGRSFNVTVTTQKNPSVVFSMIGKAAGQKNVAYWEDLQIEYSPDLNVQPVKPANPATVSPGTPPNNAPRQDSNSWFSSTMSWQAVAIFAGAIIASLTAIYTSRRNR